MNAKITLPMLAKSMAASTGRPKRLCEDFLRELFSMVSETLSAGEAVKVRGLGTFRIVDVEERKSVNVATGSEFRIPGHKRVSFTPAPQLASAVNYAFEMFEAVELSDDYDPTPVAAAANLADAAVSPDEYVLDDEENFDDTELESQPQTENLSDAELKRESDQEQASEQYPEHVETEVPLARPAEPVASVPDSEPVDTVPDPSDSVVTHGESLEIEDTTPQPTESAPATPKPAVSIVKPAEPLNTDSTQLSEHGMRALLHCRFCWGLLVGFVAAVLLIGGGYLAYTFISGRNSSETQAVAKTDADTAKHKADSIRLASEIARKDSLAAASMAVDTVSVPMSIEEPASTEVDTRPSDADQPVYDVISTTRYLTTMAREHYGNSNFWPYIYEENKSFLGHPDRIRPGTRVVVPPLSKYGVSVSSPADLKTAKQKGIEIYARYKR